MGKNKIKAKNIRQPIGKKNINPTKYELLRIYE